MKKITLALIIVLTALSSYAQQRKDLVVSVAAGKITSSYYPENKLGEFFSLDFDYHLSKRQILSANYNDGGHNYYDNILSTVPGYIKSDRTNAKASYRTFSILYKYMFINNKSISGNIGTGAGIMTHSKLYPFATSNGFSFAKSTWSDLVFPVRFELDYKISKSFHLGIIGGFYIAPDFPILAYYAGPRIGYILK
jgi:hypothetical protein